MLRNGGAPARAAKGQQTPPFIIRTFVQIPGKSNSWGDETFATKKRQRKRTNKVGHLLRKNQKAATI